MQKAAVLGGGAWGTALAGVALRAGNTVSLWAREAQTVEEINRQHRNSRYLPGIDLGEGISATGDIRQALDGADIVLLAVPAQEVSEVAAGLGDLVRAGTAIVGCAKGIDRASGRLPGDLIANALPGCPVAALSGPSFAADVARGLPTAVTIACRHLEQSRWLARRLSGPTFRCYASDDLKGVELGGALKNVLALAVGAAHGLKLGASAEAALVARGFAELSRLAMALGGRAETLTGLSGLGDLVLTCSGPQSRNFAYGVALGEGAPLDGLKLAEGVFTAPVAARLAADKSIEAPIIEAVSHVIDRRITAGEAVTRLLERPLKSEIN
ncbi:MAG: NAD(P)H-dependent glycerol-3-phosphate dehydrogenase [Pseudomonadota bacterium]|nr:NAD(P)H-dependent glycerol-3-phosphate dehydrogenase [Pseudomonadota bacterium]